MHTANTGRRTVGLHPKSHLSVDEGDTLNRLAGLATVRIGNEMTPFGVVELNAIAEPLGTVTVELPLRRAGFLGTSWDDLAAISAWARQRGVLFHLDGARIWEVAPWLDKSLAEIADLADSVYVSFYKGLGGMGGCVLAGSAEFIAAARPWRLRFGGDMPTIFPYVLTALDGLREHLPKMAEYYRHARAIASAINRRPGLRAMPDAPHGNSFRVLIEASVAQLEAAATARAQQDGVWLFNRFAPTEIPGWSFAELVCGQATLAWDASAVADAIASLRTNTG